MKSSATSEQVKPGYLRPPDYTEVANANLFSSMYEQQLRWSKALGWMVWTGKQWLQSDAAAMGLVKEFTNFQISDAQNYARESPFETNGSISSDAKNYLRFSNKMRSNSSVKSILELSKPDLLIEANEFDQRYFLLNTPSGVIDLRNGSIRDHSPTLFCSMITRAEYAIPSEDERSMWQSFLDTICTKTSEGDQLNLEESVIDREMQLYLQKSVGSCIIGKVFTEGIQIAIGSGRNGKSTFYNAVSKVLGEYAGSIDINVMTTERMNKGAAKATLRGKRLITCSELEEGQRLSTQTLKQLASTDPLTIEAKYKDPETIDPTHHIVMMSNHLPRVGSVEDGTWRRITLIPFENTIPPGNERPNYADTLFRDAGKAILFWAVEGARMFMADGCKLTQPESISKATKEYRSQEDWLQEYLDERCEISPSHSIYVGELHEDYRRYCETAGAWPRSRQEFNRALERKGFEKKKVRSHKTIWLGISIQGRAPDYAFRKMDESEWQQPGVPIS